MTVRSPLRRATGTVMLVVAVTTAAAAPAAPADPVVPSTTLPVAAPTTTAPPAATTTTPPTTAPATTTTTTPHQTTSAPAAGGPPATGVPGVPTGGGPTTTVAPGTPTTAPVPVDVGPSAGAVDADLAQINAIAGYSAASQAVPAAQAIVGQAQATLTLADAAKTATAGKVTIAQSHLGDAHHALANLAVDAYTGEAYGVPGLGQQRNADGTVASAAATDPTNAQEASVLLGVIVEHTKKTYSDAKASLARAEAIDSAAGARVATAAQTVAGATAQVAAARAQLVAATQAATVPGAAVAQQRSAELAAAQAPTSHRTTTTTVAAPTTRGGPSILGPSVVTAPELASWYATTGMTANTTQPMPQLAGDYLTAGASTGVRADLAYTQSIIETGYFTFPGGGQLAGTDNNFAGIGACDSCAHGFIFPDALTGVTAQMQLLEAYASPTPVATPLIGSIGVGGCCTSWSALAGTWASNPYYGVEILTLYAKILDWVIPQRLLAAGLPAPAGTVPAPAGTEATGPSAPVAATAAAPTTTAPSPAVTPTTLKAQHSG